jgi:hypothetical protein
LPSRSCSEGSRLQRLSCFALTVAFAGVSLYAQAPSASQWSFAATATGYAVPHTQFFISPVVTADRKWLHLEARYNYENHDTASVWTGYTFTAGRKVSLTVTPMIGGVFGKTVGVAPGYEYSLEYGKFELSSQGEYVFDGKDSNSSFFYTWSELSYSPAEWIRAGLVIQRTKIYQTGLDVQRGLLAGFSYRKLDFTSYVFNIGWTDPTVVFSIGVRF